MIVGVALFVLALSRVSAQGAGDGDVSINSPVILPQSATYTLDTVATTEANVAAATPSSKCNVEICLVNYQASVSPQSQIPMRCHALRRLEFCMRKVPIACLIEDRRYLFIESKRKESAKQFQCGFQESSSSRLDLLANIDTPLPPGVNFASGFNRYPSLSIDSTASLHYPIKGHFTTFLPSDFGIRTTIKPFNNKGGFVFAVADDTGTNRKIALEIGPTKSGSNMFIRLYWPQILAEFEVPAFADEWTRFAIKSSNGVISLFFNCEKSNQQIQWSDPKPLLIPWDYTFYLAGKGPEGSDGKFIGTLQELDIVADPDDANRYCNGELIEEESKTASGDGSEEGIVPTDEEEDITDEEEEFIPPKVSEEIEEEFYPNHSGEIEEEVIIHTPVKEVHGQKGEKGRTEESIVGPKGEPGAKGEPGIRGEDGKSGVDGINGSDGRDGAPGEKGTKGDQGPPGIGEPGQKGDVGQPGQKGEMGDSPSAPHSIPGLPGPKGEKGNDGKDGEDGDDGQKGEPGHPGLATGSTSIEGQPGPPGLKGEQGEPGVGKPGLKGEKGNQGAKGDIGPPGLTGENGSNGIAGEAGLVGSIGPRGPKGETGKDGLRGMPGPPGPPGFCVQPLTSDAPLDDEDSEGSGSAELTTSSSQGCVGGVGLPGPPGSQGPAGEPGIIGPQGPKGDQGSSGVPGRNGDVGEKGHPGEPGISGLQGERGFPGLDGKPGINGKDGENGLPGLEGRPGPSGPPGPPGYPGIPGRDNSDAEFTHGPKGQKGEPGVMLAPDGSLLEGRLNGEPGPKGSPGLVGRPGKDGRKGDMGVPGRTGTPGVPGSPGQKGESGVPGINGRAGPEGPPGPPGPSGNGDSWFGGGAGEKGSKGDPGRPGRPGLNSRPGVAGPQGAPGPKGEPGTLEGGSMSSRIFRDVDEMQESFYSLSEGTFAFVTNDQTLFVKTRKGWSKINLSGPMQPPYPKVDENTTTPTTPTTPSPSTPTTSSSTTTTTTTTTPSRIIPDFQYPSLGTSLHLIALNFPLRGHMTGIGGADRRCYKQAKRAGLQGTYRAFLSSRDQHVQSIVSEHDKTRIPIVNANGEVLFENWMEMFDGNRASVDPDKIYSFEKRQVMNDARWPVKLLWHGSDSRGKLNQMHNCASWFTHDSAVTGQAANLAHGYLLGGKAYSCGSSFIVLCIENSARTLRRVKKR